MSAAAFSQFQQGQRAPITLREAKPIDIDFLYTIQHIAACEHVNEQLPTEFQVSLPMIKKAFWFNRYVENWGRPNDLGLIASNNREKDIAAATIRLYDKKTSSRISSLIYPQPPYYELAIGITKPHRGVGLGPFMLRQLFDLAAVHNIERVHLAVAQSNEHAQHVYTHLGFSVLGEDKRHKVMALEIAQAKK